MLRPPYGFTTDKLQEQIGAPIIKWSVEPGDSFTHSSDSIVKHILKNTKDGDIIILHDAYDYTLDAIPRVIEGLRNMGFTFVTVTELLTRNGDPNQKRRLLSLLPQQ